MRDDGAECDHRPKPAVLKPRPFFTDCAASPRALHAGRPPAVLRQHGGAGERSAALAVSSRCTTCISAAQAASQSRGPPKPGKETAIDF